VSKKDELVHINNFGGFWGHAMAQNFRIYGHNCDILCNLRPYTITVITKKTVTISK